MIIQDRTSRDRHQEFAILDEHEIEVRQLVYTRPGQRHQVQLIQEQLEVVVLLFRIQNETRIE